MTTWEPPAAATTWGVDVALDPADPTLYHFIVQVPLNYIEITFTVTEPREYLPWDGWPLGGPDGET